VAHDHEKYLEYQRRYRERNRERLRAAARQRAAEMRADPEKRAEYNAYMRAYTEAHPGRSTEASRQWRAANPYHRVREHGITVADYRRMVEEQDGKCAICGEVPKARLRVDHDHSCCPDKYSCGACIRGLLCSQCNAALGGFRDDIELLKAAVKYLSRS
jgi:hypothetical protein